jgi:long-chain acyl-CoA synthetase
MLLDKIATFAADASGRTALNFNNQPVTYHALWEAVRRLQGSLAARGVCAGDCVALLLPNAPHFVISYLAVLGLGAVAVPIHAQSKAREIAWQIEDCEATALIAWDHLSAEAEKAVANTESIRLRVYLGDEVPHGAESLVELIAKGDLVDRDVPSEDSLACIMYTSGATGHPRGVELTHGHLSTHGEEMGRLLRVRDTDRVLCVLPYSGICGLTLGILLPLCHGGRILVQSRFHPGDVLNALQEEQISIMIGNPSSYALMATFPTADKRDLKSLRIPISCEAKLTEQVARDVEEKLKVHLFEGYGCTETCGVVSLNLFPALQPRGSVGQPIGGHEIAIVNPDGTPQSADKEGLIAVKGPAVMRGYHNRPDKTRHVLKDGWFITDDRGSLDYQGNLFLAGHGSELIVKGGFPIRCREIEEIVEGLPHVHEVAVVGVPDPIFGEEIKACVVLKEGAVIGPSEIMEYVKERIAIYKCPKIIKLYKELPRSPSGKIIRGQLQEEKS